MVELATGWLQNVPRPFGVGFERPPHRSQDTEETEQPGLGFRLRAPAAVSCSGFCRSRQDLMASDSCVVGVGGRTQLGTGEVTEEGLSTGLGVMWPGSCLSSFLFPHSFLGGLVPSGKQGADRVRRADMVGKRSAIQLCCDSVGPSLLISFPGPGFITPNRKAGCNL